MENNDGLIPDLDVGSEGDVLDLHPSDELLIDLCLASDHPMSDPEVNVPSPCELLTPVTTPSSQCPRIDTQNIVSNVTNTGARDESDREFIRPRLSHLNSSTLPDQDEISVENIKKDGDKNKVGQPLSEGEQLRPSSSEVQGLGQLSSPTRAAPGAGGPGPIVSNRTNLQTCRKSYTSIHTRRIRSVPPCNSVSDLTSSGQPDSLSVQSKPLSSEPALGLGLGVDQINSKCVEKCVNESTSTSSILTTMSSKRPHELSTPEPNIEIVTLPCVSESEDVPYKRTKRITDRYLEECNTATALTGPDPTENVDPGRDGAKNLRPGPSTRRKPAYVFSNNKNNKSITASADNSNVRREVAVVATSTSSSNGNDPLIVNIQNGRGSKSKGQQSIKGEVNKDKNIIRVQKNGSNSVSRLFPGKSNPRNNSGCWYPITFKSGAAADSIKTYKINNSVIKVEVKLREGSQGSQGLGQHFDKENILQVLPGLVDFRIQIESERTNNRSNRIQLVTERELDAKELEDLRVFDSAVSPEEKTNQTLIIILVEYLEYDFVDVKIPRELFVEGKPKLQSIFKLEFVNFHAYHNIFTFNLHLSSTAIIGVENYDKGISEELDAKDTIPILNYFLKPNNKPGPALSKSDSDRFYSLTRDFHMYDDILNHEIPNLIARLKDYQAKAVLWMLKREGAIKEDNPKSFIALQDFLEKKMYIPVKLRIGNEKVYYCPTSGQVTLEKFKERIPNFPSGGILADEIGLGKTFEMLSVILMNRRDGFENVKEELELEVEVTGHGTRASISALDKPKVKAKRTSRIYVPPSKQTRREGATQIQCRCGRETADPNDKEVKILTCTGTMTSIDSITKCNAKHHATCFGYDPKYLTEEVEKNYLCPTCVSKNEPVPAKSTLIVVPDSILHQWEDEICHNVADLHFLVYRGMSGSNYQPAAVLSQNDIVLTTYEILRAEIPFTGLTLLQPEQRRESRYEKRYVPLPSPLTSVGWWRVCLDEAQLVVNVKSNLSKLACRLPAVHRWCITGTPIVHSLQDLFGLVTFLGVKPICTDIPWETMIMEPFRRADTENIKNIFGEFFWRTHEEDVKEELALPPQTDVFHSLKLSPVEKLSHAARYRFWSVKLDQELNKFPGIDDPTPEILCAVNKATKTVVEKMRQLCIHPQLEDVSCSESGQAMAKFNLKVLLEKLLKDSRNVCSHNYKPLVTSLNAMAGLHILLKDWTTASKNYKQVLCLAEKYKKEWDTQDVYGLHAMTNLMDLMATNYEKKDEGTRASAEMDSSGSAENLQKLAKLVEITKESLLQKPTACLASSTKEIMCLDKNIQGRMEAIEPQELDHPRWWDRILTAILEDKLFDKLVDQIEGSFSIEFKDFMADGISGSAEKNTVYLSPSILSKKLENHNLEIKKSWNTLWTMWNTLNKENPDKTHGYMSICNSHQIVVTGESQSQTEEDTRIDSCELCIFFDKLKKFETLVFRKRDELSQKVSRRSEIDKLTAWGKPSPRDPNEMSDKSMTEITLDEIFNVSKKIKRIPRNLIEQGEVHSQLFKDLKEQCRLLRNWITKKESQICALNKILQSTKPLTHTQILNDFQANLLVVSKFDNLQKLNLLEEQEVNERISEERLILSTKQGEFDKTTTHLSYLQTLEKNGHGKYGSVNPENCSCAEKRPLGQKWGFLPCTHNICVQCGEGVKDIEASVCPQSDCGQSFQYADILFVDTESPKHTSMSSTGLNALTTESQSQSSEEILGEPFTKVEAIIRTLKSIAKNHPNEKVLVVTAWKPMLEVLRTAFHKNSIPFTNYAGGVSSRSALKAFRKGKLEQRDKDGPRPHPQKEECEWWKQVLLMPLSVASTGLNLTEASHILLVEPILNMSSELQAVGRIHRLGQTRETFIHRFYVAGTVEERFLDRRLKTRKMIEGSEYVADFEEENMSIADLRELLNIDVMKH